MDYSDIRAHVVELNKARAKAHKELNDHLDDIVKAKAMSEEDKAKEQRILAEIEAIEEQVETFVAAEQRAKRDEDLDETINSLFGQEPADQARDDVNAQLRAWMRGDPGYRAKEFVLADTADVVRLRNALRSGETPDVYASILSDTGSVGTAVQTSVAASIYAYMENMIAMFRAPTTKIVTGNGEPMRFPTVGTHAIAGQVAAQGTAIVGTDPTFSGLTLGAYKYGQLVQVSSESVTDVTFDLTGFVARDVARALSRDIDTDLVIGGGSTNPQGLMTAGWGTVATGGTLVKLTYENLVDMVYGVADEYVANGSAGWLIHRTTAGDFRKLRDGAGGTVGAVLWEPSLTRGIQNGEPDRLLGHPAYTDANVAAQGSAAKAAWFGDFASYYLRQVGNISFERSDHYAFNTDLVTFRGKWRVDGDVIDTLAGKVSYQNA